MDFIPCSNDGCGGDGGDVGGGDGGDDDDIKITSSEQKY